VPSSVGQFTSQITLAFAIELVKACVSWPKFEAGVAGQDVSSRTQCFKYWRLCLNAFVVIRGVANADTGGGFSLEDSFKVEKRIPSESV
jgi:hypothetical protein